MDPKGQFLARLIRSGARAYASGAIARMRERNPRILEGGLPSGFADPLEDTAVRLLHLAEALAAGREELLCHQIAWYKVAFEARGVHPDYLSANLEALEQEMAEALPANGAGTARAFLEACRKRLAEAPSQVPSLLEGGHPHVELARRFLLAILETRAGDALELLRDALDSGIPVRDLYAHVLVRVQQEVGRMWQMAEIHTAEEHFGSRVVERALDLLHQRMPRQPANGRRVLTSAVGGNLHDIGIRMVSDYFEMEGWSPVHLGSGIPAHDMAAALRDFEIRLVAVSASMVLHVSATAELTDNLRRTYGSAVPPILVGGSVFRVVPDLWQVVGADAGANDPAEAVEVANRLLS